MGHFVTLSSFVVSFYVSRLHLNALAGRGHFGLLLGYRGPGLADGCLALVQLVPMGCLVKEDGCVVTWRILYFEMGACAM